MSYTSEVSMSESSGSPASIYGDSLRERITLSSSRFKSRSPTRLKRAHNKVRTGCITCRYVPDCTSSQYVDNASGSGASSATKLVLSVTGVRRQTESARVTKTLMPRPRLVSN
jgi:hypothetical protein